MTKRKIKDDLKLEAFPEEITEDGIRIYGETSYENQMAVLSQFLHNGGIKGDDIEARSKREDIVIAIRDFLESKKEVETIPEINEEYVWKVAESPLEYPLFADFFRVPFPDPQPAQFTFIDLFAGMGGFRLAMQSQGGKCVFSSEWNKYAQKTYFANFGEMPFGDITKESTKGYIPKHFDILCAGFPCQPFSIAGVSKKKSLGRETGFKDKTQGTLFFDVADIISRHRPKAFYLENVKNLTSHDKGNTFRIICETLEELNYSIHYQVMDGQTYVPQHRERIMIVGFDRERYQGEEHFDFPEQHEATRAIHEILDPVVDPKYTLSDKLWNYLQSYAEKHKAKGNGFGYGLVDLNGISRTLSARYYKDGSEILIPQGIGMNPRKLSPRECARLMGYPDNYRLDQVSDVQAYRQCGNSVIVPLITAVSKQIIQTINEYERIIEFRNPQRATI
ncbi:MAG: DNA (cytosine-5-)-methyltransferase [Muribaculaceae bacterium]|nr:DNA (cytosine-5-)-methyltransferase [Muribaculaceae bacterium]